MLGMGGSKQTERLDGRRPQDVARAAELLRRGGTVAFPTETVYGLGANALDPVAVEQIFVAKQRPHWDPLIVHIAGLEQLRQIADMGAEARVVERLIARFWPGPLTLLLARTAAVPDMVTAGRALVGVRQPNHAVALELLRQAGVPVAAPSANTFSHTSPTTAQHVLDDLDGRIDAVLDGGPTAVGLESTVMEMQEGEAVVYRPGAITVEMLERVVGAGRVRAYVAPEGRVSEEALPSPGVGLRHYAPRARLVLAPVHGPGAAVDFAAWVMREGAATERLGVMLPEGWEKGGATIVFDWGPWGELETLGRRLFAGLRALDEGGATTILCPLPDEGGLGLALQDRLRKAAKTADK